MDLNIASIEENVGRPMPPKDKVNLSPKEHKETRRLSSDARRLVKKLEDQFHNVAVKIEAAAGEANLQADLGLAELESQWDAVVDVISKKIQPLRAAPAKLRSQGDRAKIKAHLARMDAEDALKVVLSSLDRMHSDMHVLQSKVGTDAKEVLTRLRRSYKNVSETLGW